MRLILFYIIQTLLTLTFLYVAYLPTFRIDVFKWGNNNTDGLYLLVVPIVFLPTVLAVSVIKYFVTKGLNHYRLYKWSFIISIASGLTCTFFVFVDALWATIVISILTAIVIIVETFVYQRQNLTNKNIDI